MADVSALSDLGVTRRRSRYGHVPLSAGEVELLKKQDEATRRRQRLLQVREMERRVAREVTERYRQNLRRLQREKLKVAHHEHELQRELVLSTLHRRYQASLQGMGTAQRNARQRIIELMEQAQTEQHKWSTNIRAERLRFEDATDAERDAERRRLARQREIEMNLKRLKELSTKHRIDASVRSRLELEAQRRRQREQEEAAAALRRGIEMEVVTYPKATPRDVTAYHFTRTHCVAIPEPAAGIVESNRTEVRVVRHNRSHPSAVKAADEAEKHREEFAVRQEDLWVARERNAKAAEERGARAMDHVEALREGEDALHWLARMEDATRMEIAQKNIHDLQSFRHQVKSGEFGEIDDATFARMFNLDDDDASLRNESYAPRASRVERVLARRTASTTTDDQSERSSVYEDSIQSLPPLPVPTPSERVITDVLRRLAKGEESVEPFSRNQQKSRRGDADDHNIGSTEVKSQQIKRRDATLDEDHASVKRASEDNTMRSPSAGVEDSGAFDTNERAKVFERETPIEPILNEMKRNDVDGACDDARRAPTASIGPDDVLSDEPSMSAIDELQRRLDEVTMLSRQQLPHISFRDAQHSVNDVSNGSVQTESHQQHSFGKGFESQASFEHDTDFSGRSSSVSTSSHTEHQELRVVRASLSDDDPVRRLSFTSAARSSDFQDDLEARQSDPQDQAIAGNNPLAIHSPSTSRNNSVDERVSVASTFKTDSPTKEPTLAVVSESSAVPGQVESDPCQTPQRHVPGHRAPGAEDCFEEDAFTGPHGNSQDADRELPTAQLAIPPSPVVYLGDDGEDYSDSDQSFLTPQGGLSEVGLAYLRQMEQEAGKHPSSSSSSIPQFSLPYSDSFSSFDDSFVDHSEMLNSLVPMFPAASTIVSAHNEDIAASDDLDETSVPVAQHSEEKNASHNLESPPAYSPAPELHADRVDAKAVTEDIQLASEQDHQHVKHLAQTIPSSDIDVARPTAHANEDESSIVSDDSSDMSTYAFNLRRVAGLAQVRGSDDQQSARNGKSARPRDSIADRRSSSHRKTHRDSSDSEASSTPSIDARLQYIVSMTSAVGKALPLHMNLQTANLARHIPVPTKASLAGSNKSQSEGSPTNSLGRSGNAKKMSGSDRSSSSAGSEGARSRHRTSFHVLPPVPFGSVDLSRPPGRAFGELAPQREVEDIAEDPKDHVVSEVDDEEEHGGVEESEGEDHSISDGFDGHSNESAQSRVQQVESMMQRLAVLPPPPFAAFDMSRPPPPLQWSFSSRESADEHEDSAAENESQGQLRDRHVNASDLGAVDSQDEITGRDDERIEDSARGGETSEGPTLNLAEAFRRRHPNFAQRSKATELLRQRREQLQRQSSDVSNMNDSTPETPNSRARRAPIPRQTPSSAPPQVDALTPEQSRLLERLASGERAKMSAQEMRERTKRLYNKLPEVLERKRQEEVLERRRQRLAEMREREKARRQMQKQRRDRNTTMTPPHR